MAVTTQAQSKWFQQQFCCARPWRKLVIGTKVSQTITKNQCSLVLLHVTNVSYNLDSLNVLTRVSSITKATQTRLLCHSSLIYSSNVPHINNSEFKKRRRRSRRQCRLKSESLFYLRISRYSSEEGDIGAGAWENRGREREGGGRTGSGKRDLQEGGKREEK